MHITTWLVCATKYGMLARLVPTETPFLPQNLEPRHAPMLAPQQARWPRHRPRSHDALFGLSFGFACESTYCQIVLVCRMDSSKIGIAEGVSPRYSEFELLTYKSGQTTQKWRATAIAFPVFVSSLPTVMPVGLKLRRPTATQYRKKQLSGELLFSWRV